MVDISGSCEVEFRWNGTIAVTRDFLPAVAEVENGCYHAVGCCGRGLALSIALGCELAEFLNSGDGRALSVDVLPPRPIAGQALLKHLPGLLLPLNRFRDRAEASEARKAS